MNNCMGLKKMPIWNKIQAKLQKFQSLSSIVKAKYGIPVYTVFC